MGSRRGVNQNEKLSDRYVRWTIRWSLQKQKQFRHLSDSEVDKLISDQDVQKKREALKLRQLARELIVVAQKQNEGKHETV